MARCGEMVAEEEDDDEYAKLVRRMNPPRVVIDNDSCDNATVIRVRLDFTFMENHAANYYLRSEKPDV